MAIPVCVHLVSRGIGTSVLDVHRDAIRVTTLATLARAVLVVALAVPLGSGNIARFLLSWPPTGACR